MNLRVATATTLAISGNLSRTELRAPPALRICLPRKLNYRYYYRRSRGGVLCFQS
jgi:hypothetical protein